MLAWIFMLVTWYFITLWRTSATNLKWADHYGQEDSKHTMFPNRRKITKKYF